MTQDELNAVHQTSLKILDQVGIRFEHDEIVQRLLKAGARPGSAAQVVRISPDFVEEMLALAPREVTLAARDGSSTVLTAESPSVYWTTPAMHILSGTTHRPITQQDLSTVARLCDHLEHVQGILGMAMDDVPPPCRDFVGLRTIAQHSRKHIRVLCFSPTGMEAVAAMKPVFPGNWFSMGFTAHGPLRWTHLALDIFLKSAGHGIPVTINGEPMAGVSGPVSLAGTVAVGNAEILAGIVVNQLLEPGRPIIYNLGLAHVFDMRHAVAVTGGPENALLAAASAAMGRFYHLPSSSWVSTEAVHEDEQAGMEKMFGFHAHSMHGVSVIWGMGQLESELTISLGQLLIDNEMIGYANRYAKGFAVNDDTLAFDLIREVGIAGNYLEADHTLTHFREHLYDPVLLNRRPREACIHTLPDVAHARAAEILAADTEEKISTVASATLTEIEAHYRKAITG